MHKWKQYDRHQWQAARFTGNKTCARCGLLPLDKDDMDSPCQVRIME